METLGSLCDKLTIVKLKQAHAVDETRLQSLAVQETQLVEEIDQYVADAVSGRIDPARLTFSANKVFVNNGMEFRPVGENMGEVMANLSVINCELWHEQEHVYEFEKVAAERKNEVVKRLAVLNIERNNCIDMINNILHREVTGQ